MASFTEQHNGSETEQLLLLYVLHSVKLLTHFTFALNFPLSSDSLLAAALLRLNRTDTDLNSQIKGTSAKHLAGFNSLLYCIHVVFESAEFP